MKNWRNLRYAGTTRARARPATPIGLHTMKGAIFAALVEMERTAIAERSSIGVAQDPVSTPKHYTVELENEKVRVLRINCGPHEKFADARAPVNGGVFLTDAHARFTYPDGKVEEIAGEAGQVLYFDAFVHDPKNLTDKPFEAIAVELKV